MHCISQIVLAILLLLDGNDRLACPKSSPIAVLSGTSPGKWDFTLLSILPSIYFFNIVTEIIL